MAATFVAVRGVGHEGRAVLVGACATRRCGNAGAAGTRGRCGHRRRLYRAIGSADAGPRRPLRHRVRCRDTRHRCQLAQWRHARQRVEAVAGHADAPLWSRSGPGGARRSEGSLRLPAALPRRREHRVRLRRDRRLHRYRQARAIRSAGARDRAACAHHRSRGPYGAEVRGAQRDRHRHLLRRTGDAAARRAASGKLSCRPDRARAARPARRWPATARSPRSNATAATSP